MRFVTFLLVFSIISLVGCVVFAYFWIDCSISLTYMKQAYDSEKNSVENLQFLILSEWKGITENELQAKLESAIKKTPEHNLFIKKEENIIWFDQTAFNIKGGKLESIGKIVY